jgi:hypothetical protein
MGEVQKEKGRVERRGGRGKRKGGEEESPMGRMAVEKWVEKEGGKKERISFL